MTLLKLLQEFRVDLKHGQRNAFTGLQDDMNYHELTSKEFLVVEKIVLRFWDVELNKNKYTDVGAKIIKKEMTNLLLNVLEDLEK